MEINSLRCIIRDMHIEDKDDLFNNIFHNKNVLNNFMAPYYHNKRSLDLSLLIDNSKIALSIIDKQTNEVIGLIIEKERKNNDIEIAFAIKESLWNHGIMSEALNSTINFLFDNTKFNSIICVIFESDIASQRVVEKCGLHYLKNGENSLKYNHQTHILKYYARTKKG